jgi:heme exporter protein A
MASTSNTSFLLDVSDLSFFRNDEKVFGPLNFSLQAGHALLIEGDNGAGKTTLLRVLAGLLQAFSGDIYFSGQASRHLLRRPLAYLSHKPCHKADLSCMENLDYFQKLTGRTTTQTIPHALQSVGLGGYDDILARQLSAGQSKRLALSRLLINPMPIWLLDEPYANLDLAGIALVNSLIQQHIEQQGAVLITSHGAYSAPAVPCTTLRLTS